MPTFVVPNSFGTVAFREFNQCHSPVDGKFCSGNPVSLADRQLTPERVASNNKYYGKGGWEASTDDRGRVNVTSRSKGFSGFTQTMSGPHEDEYRAMMDYIDAGYLTINSALRGGDTHAHVSPLDHLISRNTVDQDATLYRNVDQAGLTGLKVGDRFADLGYLSTSWDRKTVERIAKQREVKDAESGKVYPRQIIAITITKGQHAFEVEQYEGGSDLKTISEKEYLLPRGMHFIVTAVDAHGRVTDVRAVRT